MSNILVFIEHKDCVLNKTSLEAVAAAQEIEKVYMPLKTKQTHMLGNGDAKAGAIN